MIYGAIAASEIRPPIRASIRFAGAGLFQPIDVVMGKLANANFAGSGSLSVNGYLSNPLAFVSAQFAGAGNLSLVAGIPGGNGTAAFTVTLSGTATDASGATARIIIPISNGGSQISVKFISGNTAGQGLRMNNASIGIQDTTYNTLSTPVELTFGGRSGFFIDTNTTIWSDWVDFATSPGQNVIVIVDLGATPAYVRVNASGGNRYYLFNNASYNQSNPSGSWTNDNYAMMVTEIDVRG